MLVVAVLPGMKVLADEFATIRSDGVGEPLEDDPTAFTPTTTSYSTSGERFWFTS